MSAPAPALSVVVLNYNYGHYLRGCLQSILNQSFTDFELIVIDDCSKDDSLAVVEPFVDQDARVRLVAHQPNMGFAKSLIEGTEDLSRGEFRMVISADDLVIRPDAFAIQIELLRRHPNAAFCFSGVELITSTGTAIDRSFSEETVLEPPAALQALFDRTARPAHSGTMIRASRYDACGGYRRDIEMAIDLAMWVDLAIEGGFAYSPLALHGYRLHAQQMSVALSGVRQNAHEVKHILSGACIKGAQRGFGTAGMEEQVFVSHFEACALHEAFNRGRQIASYRVLATLLQSPLGALRSRKLWISAIRAALGATGFSALKGVLGKVSTSRAL